MIKSEWIWEDGQIRLKRAWLDGEPIPLSDLVEVDGRLVLVERKEEDDKCEKGQIKIKGL